jgi:hypothetical protein
MFDACLHLHTAERRLDVQEMDQTSHLFFFFLIIERLMDVQEMESLVLFFLFFIERLMDVQEIESLVQKIKVLLAYHVQFEFINF